jgi:hypothetical protein
MNRNRLTALCCAVAALTLMLGGNASSQSDGSGNVRTTITAVHDIASGAVVPAAGASLSRNNHAVFATISSSGFVPGHVVTFWWVIFNNPEFCANPTCATADFNNPAVNGSLQYGGGTVVGAGGRVSFSGYLAEGDNTGFYLNPMFPNMPNPSAGIVDAKKAQIHLALRSHGFANVDPAILQQQLTSFPGGCAVAVPACATLQAAPFFP